MEPILLIHGYGSEQGTEISRRGAIGIYKDLIEWLRDEFGRERVVDIDLGRYISLEDGIGIDDISRALDGALKERFGDLEKVTFHVVIHSTGALVVRNWVRKQAGAKQPIRNLVYLAGANFGSGWAHVGGNRLARWGRELFTGSEAGVRVLQALELGSSETIDMHLELLQPDKTMAGRGVREYVIIGSQPNTRWFEKPIRYAKEDGSDGVVRVSGANLNFQYSRFEINAKGRQVTTSDVLHMRSLNRLPDDAVYYDRVDESIPGTADRELIPLAVPYNTAHSGGEFSVVYGSRSREFVFPLLKGALETVSDREWRRQREVFDAASVRARELAQERPITGFFGDKGWKRQAQYDAHSQVIVRLFDEDGRAITDYDIFFGSQPVDGKTTQISDLIEHNHRNSATPNVLTFYLRVLKWDGETWSNRLDDLKSTSLEIEGNELNTDDIQYVPFMLRMDQGALKKWIAPNRTTVMDIVMRRVPAPDVFRIFRY